MTRPGGWRVVESYASVTAITESLVQLISSYDNLPLTKLNELKSCELT